MQLLTPRSLVCKSYSPLHEGVETSEKTNCCVEKWRMLTTNGTITYYSSKTCLFHYVAPEYPNRLRTMRTSHIHRWRSAMSSWIDFRLKNVFSRSRLNNLVAQLWSVPWYAQTRKLFQLACAVAWTVWNSLQFANNFAHWKTFTLRAWSSGHERMPCMSG